jgi:hypothetical protein
MRGGVTGDPEGLEGVRHGEFMGDYWVDVEAAVG